MSHDHTKNSPIGQIKKGEKYLIWKERSESLAVLLKRFRQEYSLDENQKITYAGRLDPMAEGLMLMLVGEARFEKEKFLQLNKTYQVEVLFGLSSDSLDVLGLVEKEDLGNLTEGQILSLLEEMKKIEKIPYPLYSSANILGRPLFVYARENISVSIPEKKVKIFSANLIKIRKEKLDNLITQIISDITLVNGDFRQKQIIESWQKVRKLYGRLEVTIVTLEITSSSGAYMRSLASWLGQQTKLGGLAYKIKRIALGEWRV